MLSSLSIRDIVVARRLDIRFEPGLCVLSGETGAGKSILLDALDLALGGRGDAALVRKGAARGQVTAVFDVPSEHGALTLLDENGLEAESPIILRRLQYADGRTRAYINDQPASARLLRAVGESLTEIHGQKDDRLLDDADMHRRLVDAFGGLDDLAGRVRAAWKGWNTAQAALAAHEEGLRQAEREAGYLDHAVAELRELDPQPGEEDALAADRQRMMVAESVAALLRETLEMLGGEGALEGQLAGALRRLERDMERAGGLLDQPVLALERALAEASEAHEALAVALRASEFDPRELEQAEERLFALRAVARKHRVSVDDLPVLLADMEQRLAAIETGEARRRELVENCTVAGKAYDSLAAQLSEARCRAAARLDRDVMAELAPLKLDKARFQTAITTNREAPGPAGIDMAAFLVATNPGADPGPLGKIASGGELARFLLALKVVLARTGGALTMVFDEIDSGVGGAVADAVGARLARLAAGGRQVLVVTHSPQVAARGAAHYLVAKQEGGNGGAMPEVVVRQLDEQARRGEIARMLSGAQVTPEARAAAARLLEGQGT